MCDTVSTNRGHFCVASDGKNLAYYSLGLGQKKKIVWLPSTDRPYFTARPKLFFIEKFFFSQKYAKLTEKYKKKTML